MSSSNHPHPSIKRSYEEYHKSAENEIGSHKNHRNNSVRALVDDRRSKTNSVQKRYNTNGHRAKIRKIGSDNVPIDDSKDQNFKPSQRQQISAPDALIKAEGASLAKALNFSPFTSSSTNSSSNYRKPTRSYEGNAQTLPPLPPILSDDLTAAVFTHQGFHAGSTISNIHRSYERLEILGDAYIEVMAIRLVYTMFPNLPAGRLSQRRELCIKNQTLAKYARLYGFPHRARLPFSFNREDKKAWTKLLGDIFEAYVAALILSDPGNGFQTAEAWLTTLWGYELSREQQGSNVDMQDFQEDAKNELMKAIGGKYSKIVYKETRDPERIKGQGKIIFHLGVYLTGWHWEEELLGSGTGLSKGEAGLVAAAEALKNPLVAEVARVKREYGAVYAAAKEKGEEPPPFKSRVDKTRTRVKDGV